MRVWILSSNRWNSAITEYALSCARSLADRGHNVTFTPLKDSPAEIRGVAAGLQVVPFASFSLAALGRFSKFAKIIQPEIVLVVGGPETVLTIAMPELPHATRIVRFRGQELPTSGIMTSLRHRLAHRNVDLVLAPSEYIAHSVRTLSLSVEVASVMLGIDGTHYFRKISPKSETQPFSDQEDVLVFGRFDPVKNHEGFLRVFALMLSQWDHTWRPRVRIVGHPANVTASHLRRWVEKFGLVDGRDVIIESAQVGDVAALLSSTLLGVVPSKGSEIICRVAEEFLLCGTPVLVSGAGSLDETLFEGAGQTWTGTSTDAERAAVLYSSLIQAHQETESVRQRRADEAKKRFSLDAMGSTLEGLFQNLLLER